MFAADQYLVLSWPTFTSNYSWYHLVHMLDILPACFRWQVTPVVTDSFDQLFFIYWLDILSDVVLQVSPYIFNYIKILQIKKNI